LFSYQKGSNKLHIECPSQQLRIYIVGRYINFEFRIRKAICLPFFSQWEEKV